MMRKFFDINGNKYDTLEEATKANEVAHAEESHNIPSKKDLLAEIEQATTILNDIFQTTLDEKKEAKKYYDEGRNRIQEEFDAFKKEKCKELEEITREYNEEIKKIDQTLVRAEKEKYDAIAKYNELYGPYNKIYTGKEAEKEFYRFCKQVDENFNNTFFNNIFADFIRF